MVAGLWQRLEIFAQVAIVAIGANRDAAADGGVEFARIHAPLLARVAFEKFLVKFPANLRDDDFLGILRVIDRHAFFSEISGELLLAAFAPDELLEGVEVDGKIPVATIGPREDFVFDR